MDKFKLIFSFLVIFFLALSGLGHADLNDGLVARWSFDNCDARDDTGNGHDGVIHGDPVCVEGIEGTAFRFDGNDYIQISYSEELAPEQFSVVVWYIAEADNLGEMVTKGIDRHYYQIQYKSDKYGEKDAIEFWYEDENDNDYYILSEKGCKVDKPFMATMTFSSGKLGAYINDKFIGEKTFTVYPYDNQDGLYIGKGNDAYFDGIIDEVRIYNRVISSSEIHQLYLNSWLWPLSGPLQDRAIALGFGDNWPWGYCDGQVKKHAGTDVSAAKGESVRASRAGTVRAVVDGGAQWRYGVTIEHPLSIQTYTTVYWHIEPVVVVGQNVERGQRIGKIADLGANTHFHFGLRKGAYSNISNRGALPQTDCEGDPAFPEFFIDPETVPYQYWVPMCPVPWLAPLLLFN